MIENDYIIMIGENRCLPDENGYETRQARFCNNTEPCTLTGRYFV